MGLTAFVALAPKNVSANIETYRAYYWRRDVWIDRATKVGTSKIVASKDLIADEELIRTEFYNDWCRKSDNFYVVGATFPVTRRGLGVLGIHRSRGSSTYTDEDKRRVGLFLPHMQRALQIRHRLLGAAAERQATSMRWDASAARCW